ncbi:hypothetical protein MED222_05845 [Vibrio sp. MED222]|nr:hypothetical protein MED222_05845 [Vibrio sp. MED222]
MKMLKSPVKQICLPVRGGFGLSLSANAFLQVVLST